MALTTYAELQTAVQDWLDRQDIAGTAPDFIALSEAYFNRSLRSRAMHTRVTLTPVSGSATLPTDFLATRGVRWLGSPGRDLTELEAEEFDRRYETISGGLPSAYTIEGQTIYVGPTNDTDIRLKYYQKIPALSPSNTTNWLLTAHPDLYLFGTLTEAELFAADSPGAGIWKQRRDACCTEINTSEQFNYRGPAPQMRIQGVVP